MYKRQVLSYFIIRRRKLPFSFSKKNIRFHGSAIKRILFLGAPIALQDLLAVSYTHLDVYKRQEQLRALIEKLQACFDLSSVSEFTVEGGRPDKMCIRDR